MDLLIFVVISNIVVPFTGADDLTEGDECTLKSGKQGTCTNVHKCHYAYNLLVSKQRPETCGFDGLTPIVCCLDSLQSTTLPTPKREIGAVSNKKCREWYPYPVHAILVPGGSPAKVAEFQHMALVGFGEESSIQWQCGGSLISENFILTAAHCLISSEFGPARWIKLGDLDISTDSDDTAPQQFQIKRRIPHPDYKRPSRYHDIALLELEKSINWTRFVSPACLDTIRIHDEKQMIATGWGRTEFAGDFSNHLLKTNLDMISVEVCRGYYGNIDKSELPNGINDELQVCAGGGPLQDTCQGDSGGPLQIISTHKTLRTVYNIVGVTSFGKACGLSMTPGVYTRVFNYLTWIEDIVWPTG